MNYPRPSYRRCAPLPKKPVFEQMLRRLRDEMVTRKQLSLLQRHDIIRRNN